MRFFCTFSKGLEGTLTTQALAVVLTTTATATALSTDFGTFMVSNGWRFLECFDVFVVAKVRKSLDSLYVEKGWGEG
jgi:hypothetical protein